MSSVSGKRKVNSSFLCKRQYLLQGLYGFCFGLFCFVVVVVVLFFFFFVKIKNKTSF